MARVTGIPNAYKPLVGVVDEDSQPSYLLKNLLIKNYLLKNNKLKSLIVTGGVK